mmetsp:Transcript_55587/g.156472  ORF Transcript_55587/g.156472 Transcript_55587/m.156472 type:complete len:478 (-) Transcript_55587:221-1654(-)
MKKLRRFLLRYDPPGVGLEVVDPAGGEGEVKHKSLPPASEVSPGRVGALVDEIIDGEPDLLTKRKHRSALIQLACRLYQIEVESVQPSAEGGASPLGHKRLSAGAPATSSTASVGAGALHAGKEVILIGLEGKYQGHNGSVGVLGESRADKDRYEVTLPPRAPSEQPETLKVKGSHHIVPVAPRGTPLTVGVHVAIRGLRNHPELNGCLGRLVLNHSESNRLEVRALETGQLFRVKQANIIPIESCPQVMLQAKACPHEPHSNPSQQSLPSPSLSPRPGRAGGGRPGGEGGEGGQAPASPAEAAAFIQVGSVIQLSGLKTATSYNGQVAEVLSIDRVRCRYEIRLKCGSAKTVRAENVRLVSGPATKSPRARPRQNNRDLLRAALVGARFDRNTSQQDKGSLVFSIKDGFLLMTVSFDDPDYGAQARQYKSVAPISDMDIKEDEHFEIKTTGGSVEGLIVAGGCKKLIYYDKEYFAQ